MDKKKDAASEDVMEKAGKHRNGGLLKNRHTERAQNSHDKKKGEVHWEIKTDEKQNKNQTKRRTEPRGSKSLVLPRKRAPCVS